MPVPTRSLALAVAAAAAVALLPGTALADGGRHHRDHPRDLLRSGLVGSTPAPAGPVLFGVAPGGAPWVLDEGSVRVRRDGRLDLRLEGLVVPTPPQNGTNPVESVTAQLYCGGTAAGETGLFPLSVPGGDARIRTAITVPDVCLAPAVLVHPRGVDTVYIAANG